VSFALKHPSLLIFVGKIVFFGAKVRFGELLVCLVFLFFPKTGFFHLDFEEEAIFFTGAVLLEFLFLEIVHIILLGLSQVISVSLLLLLLLNQFFLIALKGNFHRTFDMDIFKSSVWIDLIWLEELGIVP